MTEPASAVTITPPQEWLSDAKRFSGEWQGAARGSGISVIANRIETVGVGAKPHKHPYAETFVVRSGRVRFSIGGETIVCGPGQIVVVPAGVVHAFENHGPGTLDMIDIHENGVFDTVWVDRSQARM